MNSFFDTIRSLLILTVAVTILAFAYAGMDNIRMTKQLKLANSSTQKIIDKIQGCRVVYDDCRISVIGSNPRHVPGKFNGVVVE